MTCWDFTISIKTSNTICYTTFSFNNFITELNNLLFNNRIIIYIIKDMFNCRFNFILNNNFKVRMIINIIKDIFYITFNNIK
ncbi:MAG: hypothetical protein DBX97_23265 [Collinsella tanakaei]|nr:MAG: hypothetical protein DBX97_23265 [Collinsella tanakaei]